MLLLFGGHGKVVRHLAHWIGLQWKKNAGKLMQRLCLFHESLQLFAMYLVLNERYSINYKNLI